MAHKPLEMDFEPALRDSFHELRQSLTQLVTSTGADPTNSQSIARVYKLNNNLTWRISKIVNTINVFEAARQLPGTEGISIYIDAFAKAGAPVTMVIKAREAHAEFERVIEAHMGDRATLELAIDGMSGPRLEASRKLAFRGNSGIWGVQARVRTTAFFYAPSTDPNLADLAMIGGFVDYRRLRSGVVSPLFKTFNTFDDGSVRDGPIVEAIDQTARAGGPMLMHNFCSPSMPAIRTVPHPTGVAYEIEEGRIGNAGVFDCFFGTLTRRSVPRYRTPKDLFGSLGSQVTIPLETLILDLIVHEELAFALSAQLLVFGNPGGLFSTADTFDPRNLLPIDDEPQMIGLPPRVSTPLVPRYEEMVDSVYERAGWDKRRFSGCRVILKYPPVPSMPSLRYDLPQAPG
jgi:hypothetical protein